MNSQKSLIALEDELQMLRLYLGMERLRFKNSFDYNITFTNSIDAEMSLFRLYCCSHSVKMLSGMD